MTAKQKAGGKDTRLEFLMDLLGHDVLNSHQAVLSYLEMIATIAGGDRKTRMLAEKAIGHIRGSTMLIENVKRITSTRGLDFKTLKPVDLVKAFDKAMPELERFYPGKHIEVDRKSFPRSSMVYGGTYASDLALIMLITAIKLNQGDDIHLRVNIRDEEYAGEPAWVTTLEDPDSILPPFLNGKGVEAAFAQDISVAVKTTGLLSAKMIAQNIGGDFEAHSRSELPKKKGAVFTMTLRRADKT